MIRQFCYVTNSCNLLTFFNGFLKLYAILEDMFFENDNHLAAKLQQKNGVCKFANAFFCWRAFLYSLF